MTPPAPTSLQPDRVRLARGRRYTVRALLVLGIVFIVLGIFAVFANRQVLNANNWADTSSALLASQNVQTQVSAFLVDQVYANVDVQGEVAQALPPRFKRLAGPAAGGLRDLAQRTTDRLLDRPRVQEVWKTANRITAQQFINIAEGNSSAITSSGNAVVLDLRVVLTDLILRLGLPRSIADKIPPSAGKIKIMSSNQITTVQDGASLLRSLAIVLPVLAFAMFALAVYLARGRRRETLFIVGVNLIIAGLVVLIARNLIGDQVVNALAKTQAVQPAAEDVWSIGTRMLHDVAQAVIVAGIPVVIAAWLAGPQRPAVAFRRSVAPWLRDQPATTYGVVAALVLLVIAWGPIPATRMVIPVLVMIALVILGVEALRRQTAVEFPDATVAATRASLSAGALRARDAVFGRSVAQDGHQAHNGGAAGPSHVEQLERLSALHTAGALTDEEFAAEKASLVARDRVVA